MSYNYHFIDHTADLAVEVQGDTLEEIFIASALAFREAVVENINSKKEKYSFELYSYSPETLLVSFLNELNFRLNSERKIISSINSIKINSEGDNLKLKCNLLEENVDEDKIKTEIKSVTYHQMNLDKTDEGFKTIIVFDI